MRIFHSYKQDTDEELMRWVSRSNTKAFEELYTRYARRMQGFFIRMLGYDIAKAEDFTQELFLKVYESRGAYEEGRTFSSWAFSMAYNLCKNEYRHRDIVESHEQELNYNSDATEEPAFEQMYDRAVFENQLSISLSKLSGDQLAAFTLRYNEELSVQEIARVLDCPEGTVKSRLHYALRSLSQSLSMYNPVKP
jgi:RNA polymerase sigma factor, sigma-70 family